MNTTSSTPTATRRWRTPWWVWLLVAVFLCALAFNIYESLMRFERPGAAITDAPKGGALVGEVSRDSPIEKAGVRSGDIIVVVDGQAIRSDHDFGDMGLQFGPGKPFVLTVERAGRQMQLPMLFAERRAWQMRDRREWLDYSLSLALALLYFAMGLVLLFARPRDPGAVAGAVLLLMFAGFLGPWGGGAGSAVLFRQLPLLLQVPVFLAKALLGGYLILAFAALYPRPVFRRRWVLPVLLVPALLMIPNNVLRLYHRFYMPANPVAPGPPWIFRLQLAVEMATVLVGLSVLALGYRRLKDSHERRSLRRISFAALTSFGALVVFLLLLSSEASSPVFRRVFESQATSVVLLVLWSVFPVALARAVLGSGSRPAGTA